MEEIYSVLFDKIISGEYPAGTRLKQEDIAREFDTSRTPIRIVLQQLDQDGLVKLSHNKGAKVLPFTADEIEEIYEIRKSLELLCMDIAAPVISIQRLLELKNGLLENFRKNNVEALTELDNDLHYYIIHSTGKNRLIGMLNQLFRLLHKFRKLGFMDKNMRDQATREHIGVIDALCMRDTASAKTMMRTHIDNSKINALSALFKTKKTEK